jgi:hypothetical protein
LKKVLVSLITLTILFVSISVVSAQDITEGFDCPCRVVTKFGTVMMVDRNGKPIKQYPQIANRDNQQIYQTQNEIYVLRKNKWVWVYDINTGNLIRSYYAPDLNSWVQ